MTWSCRGFKYACLVTLFRTLSKMAVIGAGIAGAVCAQAMTHAGHRVYVFDKARGPGGRMATRRVEWTDPSGRPRLTRFDHGVPGFAATSLAFQRFTEQAKADGLLQLWQPSVAPAGFAFDSRAAHYLPVPDMPALCRDLLADSRTRWGCAVEALRRDPQGWRVQAQGADLPEAFDAVVLALPPAQAATLLAPHRRDWAQRASLALMQPCWTLMAVTDALANEAAWDVARPATGPLALIVRNDARAGRESVPGEAHWVLHARPAWSRRHLEQSATWVQAQMQSALADWLGQPLAWRLALVHRWRYANAHVPGTQPAAQCWWDADRAIGACGDFLGGGGGVEGAWLSAQALAQTLSSRLDTALPSAAVSIDTAVLVTAP